MNLRQSQRIPVDYQVWYTAPDQSIQRGTMYDLSQGGCAVATVGSVESGSRLALTILAPDHTIPITLESVPVRWTVLGEFGVEFEGLSQQDRERLGGLLDRASTTLSRLNPPSQS